MWSGSRSAIGGGQGRQTDGFQLRLPGWQNQSERMTATQQGDLDEKMGRERGDARNDRSGAFVRSPFNGAVGMPPSLG